MRFGARFLAVDWGTTNRRVYLIDDGAAVRIERDARGVSAVAPGGFPDEAAAIRARFGDLPMLLAGMVGSTLGWRVAPYVPAPAGAAEIAHALRFVDERIAIVPGVSWRDGACGDVMRGEEIQLLGAMASGLVPADALLCHPGTHCKWVVLDASRIARITTAMTGELFALLRTHSVLAPQLSAPVVPGPAFLDGVAEGARRDLAAALFGVRAAGLLRLRDDADAAAFTSGVLIGADVAARVANAPHDTVHILADPALAALYAAALAWHGREPVVLDGEAAFVAGIVDLERHLA